MKKWWDRYRSRCARRFFRSTESQTRTRATMKSRGRQLASAAAFARMKAALQGSPMCRPTLPPSPGPTPSGRAISGSRGAALARDCARLERSSHAGFFGIGAAADGGRDRGTLPGQSLPHHARVCPRRAHSARIAKMLKELYDFALDIRGFRYRCSVGDRRRPQVVPIVDQVRGRHRLKDPYLSIPISPLLFRILASCLETCPEIEWRSEKTERNRRKRSLQAEAQNGLPSSSPR
jgi:hypothetical protein